MSIAQYATREVVMVSEEATVFDAAQLMKKENVGAIVVVKDRENDLTPCGILTDRGIVTKFLAEGKDPKEVRVKNIPWSGELLVIREGQGIQETVKALADKGVRRAPVVNENNKLIGIISFDDLFILLADELHYLADLIRNQID